MSSKANVVLGTMQILLDAVKRIEAIAQEDPDVWDQVKDDFNEAKRKFKEA